MRRMIFTFVVFLRLYYLFLIAKYHGLGNEKGYDSIHRPIDIDVWFLEPNNICSLETNISFGVCFGSILLTAFLLNTHVLFLKYRLQSPPIIMTHVALKHLFKSRRAIAVEL